MAGVKRKPISGFPEFPPDDQLISADVMQRVAHHAALHGFRPLETRSVERLDDLLAKSDDLDKEMYLIHRRGGQSTRDELGLHFDLTVPLARYVEEYNSEIVFPYRRFQVQRVW
jgi:histidyl-tRNA synthetase